MDYIEDGPMYEKKIRFLYSKDGKFIESYITHISLIANMALFAKIDHDIGVIRPVPLVENSWVQCNNLDYGVSSDETSVVVFSNSEKYKNFNLGTLQCYTSEAFEKGLDPHYKC